MNNDNFDWDNLASIDATGSAQPQAGQPVRRVAPAQVIQPPPQTPQAPVAGQFEIIDLDGPRTAVRSNTWGGGSMNRWYERDGGGRLSVEAELLRRYYPSAVMVLQGGLMRVRMNVRGGRAVYRLEVIFPENFPSQKPSAFIRDPVLPASTPHRYTDGSLCLHNYSEVGVQTSAKVIIDWSVLYVQALERWQATGRWIGDTH